MIYNAGDKLEVRPLQDVCKEYISNVRTPYIVKVVSDDKNTLITTMDGGHTRTFDKNAQEWKNGHRFRFKKI